MKNSKEWFSVSELLSENLKDLPSTDKGISKKADREGWEKRQRAGVKGKTFEYNVRSMPESVQQALGFTASLPTNQSRTHDDVIITTLNGGEIGINLKARRLKGGNGGVEEIRFAVQLIEQALLNIGNEEKPKSEFNNIERHLVNCYRKASEDGKVAILNMAESMANLQEKKEEVQLASDNLNVA